MTHPVLIFDELEYEPFTENRRWPSGMWKIPRRITPAMPSNSENSVIRAWIHGFVRSVMHGVWRKLLMLFSDFNPFGVA